MKISLYKLFEVFFSSKHSVKVATLVDSSQLFNKNGERPGISSCMYSRGSGECLVS